MDCREFLNNHCVFVDAQLSAVQESEMRTHMHECPACARHDTAVRRSLMLVRSLPTIELSPGFQARLEARLRGVWAGAVPSAVPRTLRPSFGAFAAVAAGVMLVALFAADMIGRSAPEPIRMQPVVATQPEAEPSSFATSAFMAAAPTGMSVWPALMVASQTSIHFVAAELADER